MKKNIEDLKKEQLKLAKEVVLRDDFEKVKYVAGVDQSYFDNHSKIISAVVVCDIKSLKIVEKKYTLLDAKFSYIPGFIGYREGPAIVEAVSKLDVKPDVLIVDGNGILHPRRFGIASHVGMLLDIPTIGFARNLIFGRVEKNKVYIGKDMVGLLVKTKKHGNDVYVSPGHKISIGTSLSIIEKSVVHPHKMPEPLHHAHRYSKKLRKKHESEQ